MILNYVFEMDCEVQDSASDHIDNGWFEPHFHRETLDVDFEYEVDITSQDVIDYYSDYAHNIEDIQFLLDRNEIDFENLEEDKEFIEFMEDKYYDKAYKQCREENN